MTSNTPSARTADRFFRLLAALLLVLSAPCAWSAGVHAGWSAAVPAAHKSDAQTEAERLVGEVIDALRSRYIYPDVAEELAVALTKRLAEGRYQAYSTPGTLAAAVTRDLRDYSGDQHLDVDYQSDEWAPHAPAVPKADPVAEAERRRLGGLRTNFGFQSVAILPGNIGYLDLRAFYRPSEAAEIARTSMTFLAHSDAVIIDLRHNSGGNPDLVTLLAGTFFREPVHLFDQIHRHPDETVAYWTPRDLPGPRLATQPLVLLTSKETFSAGEGFAYVLQKAGRAVVVGERSAGAAHSGRFERLDSRFVIFVPDGRIVVPATGTDWEGTGIIPDLDIPAEQALDAAHSVALQRLRKVSSDDRWNAELDEAQRAIEQRLGPAVTKVRAFVHGG
jgi:hypothetical protein